MQQELQTNLDKFNRHTMETVSGQPFAQEEHVARTKLQAVELHADSTVRQLRQHYELEVEQQSHRTSRQHQQLELDLQELRAQQQTKQQCLEMQNANLRLIAEQRFRKKGKQMMPVWGNSL